MKRRDFDVRLFKFDIVLLTEYKTYSHKWGYLGMQTLLVTRKENIHNIKINKCRLVTNVLNVALCRVFSVKIN
jgi:hypothetical protein